jgi:hypothetical protein
LNDIAASELRSFSSWADSMGKPKVKPAVFKLNLVKPPDFQWPTSHIIQSLLSQPLWRVTLNHLAARCGLRQTKPTQEVVDLLASKKALGGSTKSRDEMKKRPFVWTRPDGADDDIKWRDMFNEEFIWKGIARLTTNKKVPVSFPAQTVRWERLSGIAQ